MLWRDYVAALQVCSVWCETSPCTSGPVSGLVGGHGCVPAVLQAGPDTALWSRVDQGSVLWPFQRPIRLQIPEVQVQEE